MTSLPLWKWRNAGENPVCLIFDYNRRRFIRAFHYGMGFLPLPSSPLALFLLHHWRPPLTVTGFVLFWILPVPWLPWLFPWPFQVFQDLKVYLSLSKIFKLFLALGYFSTLNSSTDTKTGVHQNARPLLLFNYSSLSYIFHASSSAVTKLPKKTSTFHNFHGPTIKSHDFPGLVKWNA